VVSFPSCWQATKDLRMANVKEISCLSTLFPLDGYLGLFVELSGSKEGDYEKQAGDISCR